MVLFRSTVPFYFSIHAINFLNFKYDNTGDLENTEQSYIYFHYILQLILSKLRFLVGISISNSPKSIEWTEK